MSDYRHAKPALLQAIPHRGAVVIEASAGTGKTYTLEHLVVELLLHGGASMPEILVVTFTEKATLELRQRVRDKLRVLLAPPADAPPADAPVWHIDGRARERIQQALADLDQATISTIHGFCHRVLSEERFFSGRLLEETQVQHDKLVAAAFRRVLRQRAADGDLVPWLEAYLRRQSVQRLEDAVVGLARHRAALQLPDLDALPGCLVRVAREAGDLAALIDAVKQASEPRSRTATTLERRLPELLAICEAAQAGAAVPALLEALERLDKISSAAYLTYLLERLAGLGSPGERIARFRAAVEDLERGWMPLSAALPARLLPEVLAEAATQKATEGLFDFDDMLLRVRDGLRGETGSLLCARLRGRYRYALIDEFQDTDEVQWEIFRTVFFGRQDGGLYLVGDPKQAIYAFRGGDVYTYLGARREVAGGGGRVLQLTDNYRSTGALIDAVNHVLAGPDGSSLFSGEVRYAHPVRCGRPQLRLVDEAGRPVAPVALCQVTSDKGYDVRVLDAMADEIGAIAKGRRRLYLGEPHPPRTPLGTGDIYVLTRTYREAVTFGAALAARGVPHALFKQEGLFQSDQARDVAALLAAVAEPEDRAKRLRAWLTPFFALSLSDLGQCAVLPDTHPLVERLRSWHVLAAARRYDRLFGAVLAESGLVRRLLFLDPSGRALTNYQHVMEILQAQAMVGRPALDELLVDLRAYIAGRRLPGDHPDANLERRTGDGQAVQIMTIHHAKGLEASLVFLYGGWSRPPADDWVTSHDAEGRRRVHCRRSARALAEVAEHEAQQEDERLLYVALTRARARLYLPLVVTEDGEAGRLAGCYPRLGTRLLALRREAPARAFEMLEVPEGAPTPVATTPAVAPHVAAQGWRPPADWLTIADHGQARARLKARHMGFAITSYSRLQRHAALPEVAATEDLPEERVGRDQLGAVLDERGVGTEGAALPPGARSGLLLHGLLEQADLSGVRGATDAEAWLADPGVRSWVERVGRAHGMGGEQAQVAGRLTYRALATPLPLPSGGARVPMAALEVVQRELEFLYPVPHLRDGAIGAPGPAADAPRGFIKGYIDAVFEHAGKLYWLDWKSDALEAFDAEHTGAHVAEHYGLQAELYTLALMRVLRIRDATAYAERFGGYLYVFLRAPEAPAVWHACPSWAEVCGWERKLSAARIGGEP